MEQRTKTNSFAKAQLDELGTRVPIPTGVLVKAAYPSYDASSARENVFALASNPPPAFASSQWSKEPRLTRALRRTSEEGRPL